MRGFCLFFLALTILSPHRLSAQDASAQELNKPPAEMLVIGPLQSCEDAANFADVAKCDTANEKAMVDAKIELSTGGIMGETAWMPHPDPSKKGWLIDPMVVGRYAFDMSQMGESDLLPDVLDRISPELQDLRAAIFCKIQERLIAELRKAQTPKPSTAVRNELIRRSRAHLSVPHPPIQAAEIAAEFCLLTGDNKGATEFATRANEEAPEAPYPLVLRAAALIRLGEDQRALVDAKKALLLDPGNSLAAAIKMRVEKPDPAAPKPSARALLTPAAMTATAAPEAEPADLPAADESPEQEAETPPTVASSTAGAVEEFDPLEDAGLTLPATTPMLMAGETGADPDAPAAAPQPQFHDEEGSAIFRLTAAGGVLLLALIIGTGILRRRAERGRDASSGHRGIRRRRPPPPSGWRERPDLTRGK
ncbi:MAG: hypothetical protein ABIJ96_09790 [Elusimicrobiota bacterium]